MKPLEPAAASAAAFRIHALIPAAGAGLRAGAQGPKQYGPVAGVPLLAHTVAALGALPGLSSLWVVVSPDDATLRQGAIAVPPGPLAHPASGVKPDATLSVQVVPVGGATRADSVRQGLAVLRAAGADDSDLVLVHDAARCLLRPEWLQPLLACATDGSLGPNDAAVLAAPVADTLKRSDAAGWVLDTVDRTQVWAAQTPQLARVGALAAALNAAQAKGHTITDEAGAIEAAGGRVKLVAGPADNFKVTYPPDFARAEGLLQARGAAALQTARAWADALWAVRRP